MHKSGLRFVFFTDVIRNVTLCVIATFEYNYSRSYARTAYECQGITMDS